MKRVLFVAFACMLTILASVADDHRDELLNRLKSASGKDRVQLLLDIGRTYSFQDTDQMIRYATEAEHLALELKLPDLAALAIQNQSTGLFQAGRFEEAMASYRRGLKAGRVLGNAEVIGSCLNGVAAVKLQWGELTEALEFFREAVGYLEAAEDQTKLAACISNISIIYYNRGEYREALEYMYRALGIYEKADNKTGIAVVLNSIGAVHGKLEQYDKAVEIFQRGLVVAREANNLQLIATFLINIGEHQMKRGEADTAMATFEDALQYARKLGNRDILAVCLNNIGEVLRTVGQYRNAMRYFQETLKLFEDMQSRPRIFASYLNIGNTFMDLEQYDEAESSLLMAYDLANELESKSKQKQSVDVLSQLYEKMGRYDKSLAFRKEYDALNQEMINAETFEKIADLQNQHDKENREKQIQILEKEREIRALQIRRQRIVIGLTIIVALLLGTMILVLYRRFRLKAKSNRMLERAYEQMEELARYDELTGLYNRRSVSERIEIEMVRMGRTWRPFSLAMVDVDDFKTINDRYGHPCGDAVLKTLGLVMKDALRLQDVASRWGGEEFLLMLPETDMDGAWILAEKVRKRVESTVIEWEKQRLQLTVTIGISVYDRPGPLSACIQRADEALYRGKRTGKNQVIRSDNLPL